MFCCGVNVVIGIINDFDLFVWIIFSFVGSKYILKFCCIGVIFEIYLIFINMVCMDSVIFGYNIKVMNINI